MEEVSSRFSKEAGSEEICIPEIECEYPAVSNIRQKIMHEDVDDDEYSPLGHRTEQVKQSMITPSKKQITTNHLLTSLTSGFDKDEDDDFNRILPNPSESTVKKSCKRKMDELDSSSYSASSDIEHEGDRWAKDKENLLKANLDLSNLKKKKINKKKQPTNSIILQESCSECKNLANEINFLKKRVSKLEKVYNVVKKNSSFDQKQSSSTPNMDPSTFQKVHKIFGVDPSSLKSPINRPTKIMRELYKNSGFELSKWKDILEPNELVLKDFIQQKCLVLDEDISHTWCTIMNSMTQMPYDAVKYKLKPNNNSLNNSLSETPELNVTTANIPSTCNTNDNQPEEQYPMTF